MDWKLQLLELEKQKKWDEAIELMQNVIKANPEDMDAYINMNYLLMNLLVEEDCDPSKQEDCETLLKWYFDESYTKFSNNAEYLYFMGRTAVMGEWFFGIDQEDYEAMIEKAKILEPENLIYKESYYWELSHENPLDPELIAYAKWVVKHNSPIRQYLSAKGSIGEYLLELKENWAKGVLENAQDFEKNKLLYH